MQGRIQQSCHSHLQLHRRVEAKRDHDRSNTSSGSSPVDTEDCSAAYSAGPLAANINVLNQLFMHTFYLYILSQSNESFKNKKITCTNTLCLVLLITDGKYFHNNRRHKMFYMLFAIFFSQINTIKLKVYSLNRARDKDF